MREASKGGRDTSEEDLVLQVKNSELVYKLCIVMRRNVLFDRSMACFYVMAIMDWVHMACTWCIVGLGNPSEAG